MARSSEEYTIKWRMFEEWHYDTIVADTPEQAAQRFWSRLAGAADENGMITFKTHFGLSQFKLSAIGGIVVQK
jgi:hypothetical protein